MNLTPEGGARASARPDAVGSGMRVAFLLRRFPALSETFVLNQITGLLDVGVDVRMFAWAPRDDAYVHPEIAAYGLMERTRYLRPPRSRLRRLQRVSGLLRRRPSLLFKALRTRRRGRLKSSTSLLSAGAGVLDEDPFDVVHCQFGNVGDTVLALQEVGALRAKLVVSFRGSDLSTAPSADAYDELFRAADLILPVSDVFRDRLIAMGCEATKIRVHRSGIDLRLFRYAERQPDPEGRLRVLSVARFVEKKGVEYAIGAVSRMRAEGRSVVQKIVGDGPLRRELEALTRDLGVQDIVQFMGDQDHRGVVEALEWAHVLVAPSVTAGSGDQEGIPNVLKEAMATGMPVVSTRHSGIPELVEEGVSGFLVPERDAESLADRLMHLADHPERWPAMGRAGRKRIEAEYDSRDLNERLLEHYREVLSESDPE